MRVPFRARQRERVNEMAEDIGPHIPKAKHVLMLLLFIFLYPAIVNLKGILYSEKNT